MEWIYLSAHMCWTQKDLRNISAMLPLAYQMYVACSEDRTGFTLRLPHVTDYLFPQ